MAFLGRPRHERPAVRARRDRRAMEAALGRDAAQETLTLTLYPRRAGRFELPTLGRAGRAPRVTVTDLGVDKMVIQASLMAI